VELGPKAAASPDADRVEPRVITSPEHCDQNVICHGSLGQIGNELSTGARLGQRASGAECEARMRLWQRTEPMYATA
jgi:hypothetical protein